MIDPDIEEAIDTLAAAFGPVEPAHHPGEPPHGWSWRDHWRDEPVGTCSRPACPWPAHTLGPDGRPWHAFCWMVPTQPISAFERWMFAKVEAGEWNGDRRQLADDAAPMVEAEAAPAAAPVVGTCRVCGGPVLPSSAWPDCHPACHQWPTSGRRYGP
jgi:hypothetical protein